MRFILLCAVLMVFAFSQYHREVLALPNRYDLLLHSRAQYPEGTLIVPPAWMTSYLGRLGNCGWPSYTGVGCALPEEVPRKLNVYYI